MRWGDYRRSDNVEDRTGGMPEGSGGGGGGFGFGGMRLGGGAMIILVIVGMLFGINPFEMLGMMGGGDSGSVQAPPQQSAPPGYGPQTARVHPLHRPDRRRPSIPTSPKPYSATPRTSGARSSRRWASATSSRSSFSIAEATRSAMRPGERSGRSVLLPGRSRPLSRHHVLQRTAQPLRRAGRLRAGVRDRARSGAPRAEPARHDAPVRRAIAARRRADAQRAVGAARAAGRLLRGRMGLLLAEAQHHRRQGYRKRTAGGRGRR